MISMADEKKPKRPRGVAKLIAGKCIACGARCQTSCAKEAIEMNQAGEPVILVDKCIGCRKCIKVCPAEAIEIYYTPEEQKILADLAAVAGKAAATEPEEPGEDEAALDLFPGKERDVVAVRTCCPFNHLDPALPANPLPAANAVDVDTGFLRGGEERRPSLHFDLPAIRQESHLVFAHEQRPLEFRFAFERHQAGQAHGLTAGMRQTTARNPTEPAAPSRQHHIPLSLYNTRVRETKRWNPTVAWAGRGS